MLKKKIHLCHEVIVEEAARMRCTPGDTDDKMGAVDIFSFSDGSASKTRRGLYKAAAAGEQEKRNKKKEFWHLCITFRRGTDSSAGKSL